jgi:anaerobic magnesium-protoporphyrin IX monomethyl ester cyclase
MRVVLFLVGTPEMSAQSARAYGVRYPIMSPPATLLILAAIARAHQHDVALADTRLYMTAEADGWRTDWQALIDFVRQGAPDVIGISFLSSSAQDGLHLARLCRQACDATIVGGGLHAAIAPQEFAATHAFDYLIQGEGEQAFPALLANLASGALPCHAETQIIDAPAVPRTQMSLIPAITDFSPYQPALAQYQTHRSIYVELARGCVKTCSFCEVARGQPAYRPFRKIPLETIYTTIRYAVQDHGVNYVLVGDSIATLNAEHFLAFIAHMRREYPTVNVQFNSTVDLWTEKIAQAVHGMPCTVWFGFESGSQRILEIIAKGTTVAQAHAAAALCARYGVRAGFNVLIGIPDESDDDYQATIAFFEQHTHLYPNPNILNPLPGTAMYRQCQEGGLLRNPRDYSIWTQERIEAANYQGPILSVDYHRVLKYRQRLIEMQSEAPRALA